MVLMRVVRGSGAVAATMLVSISALGQALKQGADDRLTEKSAPVFEGELTVDTAGPRVTRLEPGASVTGNTGVAAFVVEFSEPVTIPAGAFAAWTSSRGVLPTPLVTPISPMRVIVSLNEAVRDDRVTLIVDSTVTDLVGNPLDGEVASPATPALPSGDGIYGGPAVFRVNVLQGDADGNGAVDDADAAIVVASIGRRRGQPGFDARADLNGDGVVNVLDVAVHRGALGRMLPPTDGVPPTIASTSTRSAGFSDDFGQVVVTFSERINAQRFFNTRTAMMVDTRTSAVFTPLTATLSSNRQTVTYSFVPPLPACASYELRVSNAISDTLSELLVLPTTPVILTRAPVSEPRWSRGFHQGGFSLDGLGTGAEALTVYDDDGTGPNSAVLVAGSRFDAASGREVGNIAKWDPRTGSWSSFGLAGANEIGGSVLALVEYDDDGPGPNRPALVAGGTFNVAAGIAANNVARWNPRTGSWSSFGTGTANGVDGTVRAIVPYDEDGPGPNPPALIVAGSFVSAGGVGGPGGIARWNPLANRWERLGTGPAVGFNGTVSALTLYDDDGEGPNAPALIAGGSFTTAGGASVQSVAKWNPLSRSWSGFETGSGPSASVVSEMVVYDDDGAGPNPPALVVGGRFTSIGGVAANHVARWNPVSRSWSSFGEGDANGIKDYP